MKERWGVRVARWLVRRYPASLRQRYGDEIEADLGRASRAGASGMQLARDALWTLVRSWRDVMRQGGRVGDRGLGTDGLRDVRQALRGLLREPLHGAVAVATLAFAMGGNAAVFSVAYAVLMRTLPYASPERTVRVEPAPVYITQTGGYAVASTLTGLPQIESSAVFTEGGSANLVVGAGAEPVRVTHVDGEFFSVLGARLGIGRAVVVGGEGGPEVVLSHGLWQRAFGGDASVVGRTVHLSGHAVTVAGVAAPEVDYPAGTDVWLSYPVLFDLMGAASGADVIARVARVEQIAEARELHEARVRAAWAEAGETFPSRARPELTPLRASLVGPAGDSLTLLFVASALVLLLGCVNLAGLSLARNSARTGEFAMRRALGAGRARLVRMLMAESLVIALIAGVFATAFVFWGRTLLVRLLPAELPGLAAAGGAVETLGFVLLLTVMTGLAVGLLPALHSSLGAAVDAGAAGRLAERKRRLHPALVIGEIALAIVLVACAGLLGRSVLELRSVPLGFDTDRVYTFEARLPWAEAWEPDRFVRFSEEVRARLAAQPGVTEVGITARLPLSDGLGVAFRVWPADRVEAETNVSASSIEASTTFFAALGVRFVAGSVFAPDASAAGTIVVSRSLAEQLFSDGNVVGEAVRVRVSMRTDPTLRTIVGVVDDVRPGGFLGEPRPTFYVPFHTQPTPSMAFVVRADRRSTDVFGFIRQVVREVDPTVAPFAVRSMRSAASDAIAAREALAIVSGLFGVAGLVLAILGIYGLVAQGVTRRRREMGVRLAVGARAGDLLRLILRGALGLAAAGIVVGLLAALAATRLLSGFLYGVGATDPVTFLTVVALGLLATLAASLGPAARAARTDPMTSLRSD